jgi:hypothetical protein
MEAPDKIYLEKSLSFPDKFHRHWYKEDIVGNGIEYIRKDKLIEWTERELEKRKNTGDDYFYPAIVVLEDLIDKLNEL